MKAEDMIQTVNAAEIQGAAWRKSQWSNPNGACVEMTAAGEGRTAVRDSTDPFGPALVLGRREMQALLAGVTAGTLGSL